MLIAATERKSPPETSSPTRAATPANPTPKPTKRIPLKRLSRPIARAMIAAVSGTVEISKAASELEIPFSAHVSAKKVKVISTIAKMNTHRQWPLSFRSCPVKKAIGSIMAAPINTRANTTTNGESDSTPTLISR